MADVPTTTTTANDVQYSAAVSEQILRYARASAVFWDKILRFPFPVQGPRSMVVPRHQDFTIASLSEGTAQDASAVSTDGATLSLSRKGGTMLLSDESVEGAVPTFKPGAIENAGLAMAKTIDADGLALATGLSIDDFRRGIYLLEVANAPDNVALEPMLGMATRLIQSYLAVLHPVQILHLGNTLTTSSAGWLAADPKAAGIAMKDGALPPGYVGTLLGVPVFRSTECPLSDTNANRNGMIFSPAAFGFGAKYIGRVETDRDIKARADIGTVTSDFGYVELVDGYASRVRSSATA
jgi:hypothetical protein